MYINLKTLCCVSAKFLDFVNGENNFQFSDNYAICKIVGGMML